MSNSKEGTRSTESSERSSGLPSSSSSTTAPATVLKAFTTTTGPRRRKSDDDDDNLLIIENDQEEEEDDGGGGIPTTTTSSSSSSSKPFIWKPPDYPPVQEQTIRPSRDDSPHHLDARNVADPETFAVPTDAEMASLTATECPVLIRQKSRERHTSSSSNNRKRQVTSTILKILLQKMNTYDPNTFEVPLSRVTKLQEIMERNTRTASVLYYTSVEPNFHAHPSPQDPGRKKIYQSRRIPQWAWRLLSRSLGIKVTPGDTPLLGTLLHMATLMFACMFCVTGAWYIFYDVRSNYTRTTLLIGSIAVVIGFGWVAIGIYANKLAVRLISNKNFGENVRMHSRTIFKVSSAGLLFFLCLGLISVNIYHTYCQFQVHSCKQVGTSEAICIINLVGKTGFGVLALIWNCLVGCVLLSVCRTHTIGIRRFMRELEADGQNYELYWKSQAAMLGTKHVDIDQIPTGPDSECGEPYVWYDGYPSDDDSSYYGCRNSTNVPKLSVLCQDEDSSYAKSNATNSNQNSKEYQNADNIEQNRKRLSNTGLPKVGDTQLLSNSDILLSYWKISWRMRITSLTLQRWLASWIVFIVTWCGNYIIFWMSNEATPLGIVEFIIPLLLLLLISSAFAEANAEGQRMIRCICPTEERIFLLLFLNQQPLQMTVFNFALTYNAIVGVVLAFSVAFASKVIKDEVFK